MVFNSTFGFAKFNFALLIYKLKNKEEVIQKKYLGTLNGEVFPRNKRYVILKYI